MAQRDREDPSRARTPVLKHCNPIVFKCYYVEKRKAHLYREVWMWEYFSLVQSASSPEGRLMRFPSFSLRRERLNLPFLFFTLGLSLLSWKMRMLSSLSSTLISRSASCCSRRFSNSSWDFCCRAARVSSSSLERSSWKKQVLRGKCIYRTGWKISDGDTS